MSNKTIKKLAVFYLLFAPLISNADTVLDDRTVSSVHVNLNSGLYFNTYESMSEGAAEGCSSTNHFILNKDKPFLKEAYALLVAARMTGQKIKFALVGCRGQYPEVQWLRVHD